LQLPENDGFQEFDRLTGFENGTENSIEFNGKKAILGVDFIPVEGSESFSETAELVFAGFGFDLSQDSLSWNDYDGIDIQGKWVMSINDYPRPNIEDNIYSEYYYKNLPLELAIKKGAAGVILINSQEKERVKFDKEDSFIVDPQPLDFPALCITRKLADEIMEDEGWHIDELEKLLNENLKPHSFELNTTLNIEIDVKPVIIKERNVLGIIEGNDPILKESYIILGAHYDHIEFGKLMDGSFGFDSLYIHNGADDNASGVAGLLEIASRLGADKPGLKRSILFIAFDGEESMGFGSHHFLEHSPVNKDKIMAMINLDMIGRLNYTEDNYLQISGTNTFEEFEDIFKNIKVENLNYKLIPEIIPASDHLWFYEDSIPDLCFMTGFHEDYHSADDDWQKLNYEGEKQILDMIYDLMILLANRDRPLTFHRADPKQ
jgi:hypothetical protein